MTERCIWLGFQEDILPVLAATDVLLRCSEREALGLSVIEAMAMGVPVVVTDDGGMPEIVHDKVKGLVVPAGEVAAIAGALVEVLGDWGLATALGAEGRRRGESCFTAQQCAERVMSVFDSV